MPRILLCDDDSAVRSSLRIHLEMAGYDVSEAPDGANALRILAAASPDLMLLDLRMPKLDGLAVLKRMRDDGLGVPTIVITAYAAISSAVEATKLGAAGYIAKPFEMQDLLHQLSSAMPQPRTERLLPLPKTGYGEIVGASPQMQSVFATLRRLEGIDAPTVLIAGESGTGKDLVARAIHAHGPRQHKPFMAIDCAAMPETLIESELFGHEKGSFTDARTLKRGLFEMARGGVIFLDEIGEMSPSTQAKLLRALENRRFKRVGGVQDIPVDAAIIAATNRNLREEMKAGRFREDLFFRLNVVPIEIPPLRVRPDDVEELALRLAERTCRDLGRPPCGLSTAALVALKRYPWPGNVRELRNVIERAVILKDGSAMIDLHDLPSEVRSYERDPATQSKHAFTLPAEGVDLENVERSLVEQAVERAGGNRTKAARLLGISRFALRYRLEKYGITTASILNLLGE